MTEEQLLYELADNSIRYESIIRDNGHNIHSFHCGYASYDIYIENGKVISKGLD